MGQFMAENEGRILSGQVLVRQRQLWMQKPSSAPTSQIMPNTAPMDWVRYVVGNAADVGSCLAPARVSHSTCISSNKKEESESTALFFLAAKRAHRATSPARLS
jgi:hypothetical protein